MNYEELKKEKINEWLEYLTTNNEDDILWKQKNRIYATSVFNCISSVLREKKDDIASKQLEIENSIGIYIESENREMVYNVVKQLKDLEDGKQIAPLKFDNINVEPQKKQEQSLDMISITKEEYNELKQNKEEFLDMMDYKNDFSLKINSGTILPMLHPNYYDGRIKIEIVNIEKYFIQVEEKKYRINYYVLNKIRKLIDANINDLIKYSISQNKQFFMHNSYEGGIQSSLSIKYGQLIINLEGKVLGNVGVFCKKIINDIKDIIVSADIIEVTNEDDTIKLLVEKIKAMPNGTEFTISQLIDKDIDIVLDIAIDTFKKLEELGIVIKSKSDSNAIGGLPQNMIFVKV